MNGEASVSVPAQSAEARRDQKIGDALLPRPSIASDIRDDFDSPINPVYISRAGVDPSERQSERTRLDCEVGSANGLMPGRGLCGLASWGWIVQLP
ncbi:MAG TPA: hypothetical protein VFJ47_15435 [Terriglobales bacterium]|nr:hypothetical protein [Terriglobales bacterium]